MLAFLKLIALAMIGSGLLITAGGVTWMVLRPPTVQPSPSVAASAASPLSPGNPSQVLTPPEAPSGSQKPVQRPTGALPSVVLPTVPQLTMEPSFIPVPTPPLPPVPSVPDLGRGCYEVEVTPNTPTGIAGCIRFGQGTASTYTGTGAAMNFCTWSFRMNHGCGTVKVTTRLGASVRIPVTDFCDCYTGTMDERIIDLPLHILPSLGLNPLDGLYPVMVER